MAQWPPIGRRDRSLRLQVMAIGLVGFGFLAPPTEITVKAIAVKVAQKGELGGQKETARLMAR